MSSGSAGVLVNGVFRMQSITTTLPSIYDQRLTVVASGASGSNQVNGPVTSGTLLTLPSSGTFSVVSGVTSLTLYLNNTRMEYVVDWTAGGSGGPSTYTQFSLSFDLVVGDYIDLRQERST